MPRTTRAARCWWCRRPWGQAMINRSDESLPLELVGPTSKRDYAIVQIEQIRRDRLGLPPRHLDQEDHHYGHLTLASSASVGVVEGRLPERLEGGRQRP